MLYDVLGGNGQDCHGHGRHVAGTVGALTYDVAKTVKLWAVRVLTCSGSGADADACRFDLARRRDEHAGRYLLLPQVASVGALVYATNSVPTDPFTWIVGNGVPRVDGSAVPPAARG